MLVDGQVSLPCHCYVSAVEAEARYSPAEECSQQIEPVEVLVLALMGRGQEERLSDADLPRSM
jgi:hypothetical protein